MRSLKIAVISLLLMGFWLVVMTFATVVGGYASIYDLRVDHPYSIFPFLFFASLSIVSIIVGVIRDR